MTNSFVAKKDLDSEMTVVRNEFEANENNPLAIMTERTVSTSYLWHNYGKSVLGARSDIERMPIERLQAFYKTYYQPDNATLMVAGMFDEAKTLALINQLFGIIPRPARTLPKTYTLEPAQDGERTITLRRAGDVQAVAALYHAPAGSHPDFPALNILSMVLADVPAGRLHKTLVETNKASSIFSYNYQQREPGLLLFGAEVRKGAPLTAARAALISTIEMAGITQPTKAEVERARLYLLKNIELALTSVENIGLSLSTWIAMGDWRLFFLHRDRLRKVTPEDVRRVAAHYLKPSNRTIGTFIPTAKPERVEIPEISEEEIAAALKDYKGDAAVAGGEVFDPSPERIESRVTRTEAGGLKMALLPKRTRGQIVVANLTLRFGDERSLRNRSAASTLAWQMLLRGTTRHTRQQIVDELDRLKAQVGINGDTSRVDVSIQTTRENLAAVMRLVAEILRVPSFPAAEFATLKQEALAAIEQSRSDPQSIALNVYDRHLYPYPKGDTGYIPTPEEEIADIKRTTLQEVKRFHSDFYGASNAVLSVVGDFESKEMTALAGELFGSWRSPKPYTRIPEILHAVEPLNRTLPAPDKANAFIITGFRFPILDTDPDFPAMLLGNYLLGVAQNARLWTRIREREGLSYGVGSSFSADPVDKSGGFSMSATFAPQNAARLEAALKEEIGRALKDGFSVEEVETAKSSILQQRQLSRADDFALSSRLATYLFYNRTLQRDAELDKRIRELTPEQISEALRRHIVPEKFTMIKAGNF
jgi:zinc protease